MQTWDIAYPSAQPAGGRPKPSGKDPIKIVHYSDIHIDPLYVPGSSTQCDGRPICCRYVCPHSSIGKAEAELTQQRPYTKDDQPGNTKFPAGPNGDHMCDVPFTLERSMYDAINSIVPDAAFTIFTGDIVDHAIWNTSQPYNTNLSKFFLSCNAQLPSQAANTPKSNMRTTP